MEVQMLRAVKTHCADSIFYMMIRKVVSVVLDMISLEVCWSLVCMWWFLEQCCLFGA